MRDLNPMEIGVMFWGGDDPASTLAAYTRLGIRSGQLGIPPEMQLNGAASAWKNALAQADFTIYSVFAAFEGESYTDIPTVRRTVGFVPRATRMNREKRMFEVSDLAAELGVQSVATHIGCVPEDRNDPDYEAVRDVVRRLCDHIADRTFALETGQESAAALVDFMRDTARENLAVNFDPANMILYGTGDPIEALEILGKRVISVHLKDGDYPDPGRPGSLGTELPTGAGKVGFSRFIEQLQKIGYKGPMAIEREASDPDQRMADIKEGIEYIRRIVEKLRK